MKAVCTYNVNLDALHKVTQNEMSDLVKRTPIGESPPSTISSLGDFLTALLFHLRDGSGGELLVKDKETANFISRLFCWDYRLGGNAGNVADALAREGVEVVLNVPSLTLRQASFLDPRIRIPVSEGRSLAEPLAAVRPGEDLIHFVIQFDQGMEIPLHGGVLTSPRENRFIATFDPLNPRLCSNKSFDNYCEYHANEIDGALISGFHLVPALDFEPLVYQKAQQVSSWKKANPKMYIHVEMGSFQKPEIMTYLLENLVADSVGMNEDELYHLADHRFIQIDWKAVMEMAIDLLAIFGKSRVCVHTKDWVISVSKGFISPKDEVDALIYGTNSAGALVETGSISGPVPTNINPRGAEARDDFVSQGAKPCGRGAYTLLEGIATCLVPSLWVEHPNVVVGTGDALTATCFVRELMAVRAGTPRNCQCH